VRLPPATLLLLGFAGPKTEAEEIKRRLGQFLREELKLELSEEKTLITHARTDAARFLGYEITVAHDDRKLTAGRRSVNGGVQLRVPADVIKAKCARYMRGGKPTHRPELKNESDYSIVSRYGAEYRGIVQYYLLAGDVRRLNRLHWVMLTSLLKTLACKYGSSVSKMARRYGATIQTPHGPRKCMQATVNRGEHRKPMVATFGGIPLQRQTNAVLIDREPVRDAARGSELIRRLLAGRCELCGQAEKVQVHQIRKLADLHRPGQPQAEWTQHMAKRRRKTLVVCDGCHASIHDRQPTVLTA
jgi:Type II intron maturase